MRTLPPAILLTLLAACGRGESRPAADAGPAAAQPAALLAAKSIAAVVGDSASTIEGMAEHAGKLYTIDWKDGSIYRLTPDSASTSLRLTVERVGTLGTKPGTVILGIAADTAGNLYAAAPEGGIVYQVRGAALGTPGFNARRDVRTFATGAPGANGVAFDPAGRLWVTAGSENGLYLVPAGGGKVTEVARGYATMAADTSLPVRIYVTNGIAFDAQGNAYTANTGTGEITKVAIQPDGTPGAITSFVKDPRMVGADGLIMDPAGNLYVAANYRSALFRVTPDGQVALVTADSVAPGAGHAGQVLRFPAELKMVGNTIYIANLNFKVGANTGQSFTGASVAGVRVN